MNLYIYSYNNYYNRIVKKAGDSVDDYFEFLHYGPIQGVYGFTPGDGINTTQLLGTAVDMYDGKGNYLIAADDNGEIDSRWFIISVERTRNGQWKLTLHRDLIVDFYDTLVNADMFIEKATLHESNPLVFNSEAMTVNQIKTSETLLMDKSNCPWIVGYYAKNTDDAYLSGTVNRNILDDSYDILIDEPFSSWKFNATETPFYLAPSSIQYGITAKQRYYGPDWPVLRDFYDYKTGAQIGKYQYLDTESAGLYYSYLSSTSLIGNQIKANSSTLYSQLLAGNYIDITSDEDSSYFLNLQGKIIKDSTGRFYHLGITPKSNKTVTNSIPAGSLFNTLGDLVLSVDGVTGAPDTKSFEVRIIKQEYVMVASELTSLETSWDLNKSKLSTEDAPYNIFAIPLGETTLELDTGVVLAISNREDSLALASSIIQTMTPSSGGGFLYDIQLLPYCPLTLEEEGVITITSPLGYSPVVAPGDEVVGYILNIPKSRFTKNIYLKNPITVTNTKIQNECDVYKLCSPNWASEFQFSAAKNGGIEYFNIDCEYKPFTPYIHINPNFGGLYGRDFDDARGLILSGDFSLTQVSSEWQSYQIQNKNFQNIFDRQIQNMETTQGIQKKQELWSLGAGTLTGATSGALAGSMIAPGVGTAVGAAVGGIASLAGGIADYNMNNQLRAEALDYKHDMFGYQLGNIKALPYTLTKVSSYNNNNKLFPILEYYTCTDEEKKAFANKIAWNGMTVMTIGKMSDYIGNEWSYTTSDGEVIRSQGYIKGQLIRFELPVSHRDDLHSEDYQLVNAISGELYKGVYIK